MTFHRAPPELSGLGVRTLTPGLTRSSQPLMFFGLPLRTTSATTDRVTKTWYASEFQVLGTSPPSTSLVMWGAGEGGVTSGGRPAVIARASAPEVIKNLEKITPLPSVVFSNA